jgi:hypothetical protein
MEGLAGDETIGRMSSKGFPSANSRLAGQAEGLGVLQ